jgi:hypothetical protein
VAVALEPAQVLPAAEPDSPAGLERLRVRLADGAETTVHLAVFDAERTALRVAVLRRPQPLGTWCRRRGVGDALVGGFYVRPHGTPLGELRTRGMVRRSVPFDAPWDARRACLHLTEGGVRIAARAELPAAPVGDLLQAGPLLVRDGAPALADGSDPEGFSSGSRPFDSDITAGRYPRAALGMGGGRLLALACDGRADDEAGLTLGELAGVLVSLGAETALNLDGGGSTSLVRAGRLRNVARAEHGVVLPRGRPVSTALVFRPRPAGPLA